MEGVKIVEGFDVLPTGKTHVSFSETRDWVECSYRHKLKYVDKLGKDLPGVHMDFGTACHEACESFLKTGVMDPKVFKQKLYELWKEHAQACPDDFSVKAFKQFAKEGIEILSEFKAWFDETFPGWKFIDAEHFLYERIGERHPHAFKGYIDCIIKAPGPRGADVYWLLDWKTCGWGWTRDKKSDDLVKAQLILYKNFWSKKANVDPGDIRCGFVLLKRTAKPGHHLELVKVSVGNVTTHRSLTVVNNMLNSVKKGIAIKNRNSCKFCEFFETELCT